MYEDVSPANGTIVLNKYRILEEIGRGGMGVIYLAEDIRLGRQVAIKELVLSRTIQGKEKDDIISRFQREARTTSTLNHPNIVTIFDVGEDQNRHFIAMEYLPGKTLKDYLDEQHNFMLEEILDIFIQVASALDHAHSKGVIHRDIKPDNVKILQDNVVKIMDFGIAGLENRSSNLTQDGTILGTIAYISPEQLYNSKNVTVRADLFSYGVMMYEMFTHKLPFDGDTVGATIMLIMSEQPQPPRAINARIPERIEKVILRCLEKDPTNRFESAKHIVEELMAYRIGLSNRELRDMILDEGLVSKRAPQPTGMASFRMTNINSGGARIGKFKLLHVEDDIMRQQLLVDYIKHLGLPYEVAQTATVAKACQLISQQTYDFVICDYMLKDGTAEPVLELLQNTPLIMVTSMNQPQTIIKLMKKGAVDYILKSNAMEEIRQIISIIKSKTSDQELLTDESLAPAPAAPSAAAETPAISDTSGVSFERIVGRQGSKPGEFASPRWIRFCPYTETLQVADTQNSRVQILSPSGEVIRIVEHPDLKAPCALTSTATGQLYVLDAGDAKIRIFDSQGNLEQVIGGKPAFKSAFGLAMLPTQELMVTDPEGHCLHILDAKGELRHNISEDFKSPSGITLAQDQVYVLDHGLPAVLRLDTQGKVQARFGKRGTGKGDFSIPKGIAINEQGHIFVAEALSHRVQVFDAGGNWLTAFGKKGNGEGEFTNPESLACQPGGLVYVLDRGNHRIQVFKYQQS
ncbi:MAG TPA: protein kinase [Candidatus Obscuribacterales bacterium]